MQYRTIGSIRGPLSVVQDVSGVGWDETARVTLQSGEVRHGTVLEVDRGLAVVVVLEGTSGVRLDTARIALSGAPMQIPVGEAGSGAPATDAASRSTAAIDGLATLVRGQKLPIFSVGGLPHLAIAAQIAVQAHVEGEPFAIVFVALGLPHADVHAVRAILERRAQLDDLALFVNTADDPVVERIVTPRVALTVAEYLAFEQHRHVLVVLADLTNYCEACARSPRRAARSPADAATPGTCAATSRRCWSAPGG